MCGIKIFSRIAVCVKESISLDDQWKSIGALSNCTVKDLIMSPKFPVYSNKTGGGSSQGQNNSLVHTYNSGKKMKILCENKCHKKKTCFWCQNLSSTNFNQN